MLFDKSYKEKDISQFISIDGFKKIHENTEEID